jgi:hypothetical protein
VVLKRNRRADFSESSVCESLLTYANSLPAASYQDFLRAALAAGVTADFVEYVVAQASDELAETSLRSAPEYAPVHDGSERPERNHVLAN